MKPLKHWMVALDLTDMDAFLLGYTQFLARTLKPEKLTFLHIVERSSLGQEELDLFPDLEHPDEIIELIKEEMEENVKSSFETDITWSTAILRGDATDTMINAMKQYDPDLLLMGKKTGYEGEGVIAKKIIRYMPCSVLLVPETSRHRLKHLLIPVEFNEHSANALMFACEFADRSNARITAQHVYQYPPQFFPGIPVDEFREKMQEPLRKKLDTFKKEYSLREDINFIFTLNRNKTIPDRVYDYSVKEQADMILVGARNRSTLSNVLMDDLADRMIQYIFGIPLLVFKDKQKFKGIIRSLLS